MAFADGSSEVGQRDLSRPGAVETTLAYCSIGCQEVSMPPVPSPRASYIPATREAAARNQLHAAREHHAAVQARLEDTTRYLSSDERHRLREQLQGAKAEIRNCERYIAAGCPRVRETV